MMSKNREHKVGINRKFFFEQLKNCFSGASSLRGKSTDFSSLLDLWERDYAKNDDRWLAYSLGTAYHEVAFTMQPIHERGGPKYFFYMYDKDGGRPKVAAALGNTEKGDRGAFMAAATFN